MADKYGDERRTEIMKVDEQAEDLPLAAGIPVPEETVVVMTRGGQARRMSPRAYDKAEAPETSADMPRYVFQTMSDHPLLFFTQYGNCYSSCLCTRPRKSRGSIPRDRGTLLAGVLNGLEDERQCIIEEELLVMGGPNRGCTGRGISSEKNAW